MQLFSRNNDVIFGNADLEQLYCFKKFPIFMGCTNQPQSDDVFADMNWCISANSGLIQLTELLPLEILYQLDHGSGTTGTLWDDHHTEFAKFISKYNINTALEIGGLHGILANKYLNISKDCKWTIIEPNPMIESNGNIVVIKGFFDNNFKSATKYDAIVHSHVLEHIYDPDKFMMHISSFMHDGSIMIFSIPNLAIMLERKYTNCINFEHSIYLTEDYVNYFLSKYKFKLIEKQYFKVDHSIFYCVQKDEQLSCTTLPQDLYKFNKCIFNDYINYHISMITNINQIIDSTNLPIYLFGAHIFSQYLISFGLNVNKIECVLDNDARKHNQRLYGTNLMVNSPEILKNIPSGIVILKAGIYNDEIKNDILQNINPNIIFI
jgi:hypothetical protein